MEIYHLLIIAAILSFILELFTATFLLLSVGIGFGFQKVTDNLISGLTILIEEPVKVGDRVEVGEVTGDIVNISLRSTTVLTNDNISIISMRIFYIIQTFI